MCKQVKNRELFSKIPKDLASLFSENEYPWDALKGLKQKVDSIIASHSDEYKVLRDGVLIGENVSIHPSAVIEPPAVIGKNTQIRPVLI